MLLALDLLCLDSLEKEIVCLIFFFVIFHACFFFSLDHQAFITFWIFCWFKFHEFLFSLWSSKMAKNQSNQVTMVLRSSCSLILLSMMMDFCNNKDYLYSNLYFTPFFVAFWLLTQARIEMILTTLRFLISCMQLIMK